MFCSDGTHDPARTNRRPRPHLSVTRSRARADCGTRARRSRRLRGRRSRCSRASVSSRCRPAAIFPRPRFRASTWQAVPIRSQDIRGIDVGIAGKPRRSRLASTARRSRVSNSTPAVAARTPDCLDATCRHRRTTSAILRACKGQLAAITIVIATPIRTCVLSFSDSNSSRPIAASA